MKYADNILVGIPNRERIFGYDLKTKITLKFSNVADALETEYKNFIIFSGEYIYHYDNNKYDKKVVTWKGSIYSIC